MKIMNIFKKITTVKPKSKNIQYFKIYRWDPEQRQKPYVSTYPVNVDDCGPMVFFPFVGAAVEMKGRPTSPLHESLVALAGPVMGSVAAFSCLAGGVVYDSDFLTRLAYWGCVLNLLNLLPIGHLDGGRIAATLGDRFMRAGLVLCGAAFLVQPTSLILSIFFCAADDKTF